MAIDQYQEYTTLEGDRPDLIAYRYYGNQFLYPDICKANPFILGLPILPGGLLLKIPVKAIATAIPAEMLPPWKR